MEWRVPLKDNQMCGVPVEDCQKSKATVEGDQMCGIPLKDNEMCGLLLKDNQMWWGPTKRRTEGWRTKGGRPDVCAMSPN